LCFVSTAGNVSSRPEILRQTHKKTLGHILPQRFFMAGFQINTRAKNTKPPVA
jgi:hypothetical protein